MGRMWEFISNVLSSWWFLNNINEDINLKKLRVGKNFDYNLWIGFVFVYFILIKNCLLFLRFVWDFVGCC